jgi:hypothetical protein
MISPFFALLVAVPWSAQEKTQDDLKRLAGDAARALQKSAKPGSFEFTGSLKTEVNPDDKDAEPTECKVTGAVGSPFTSAFKVKSDASTHDIVFKRGTMAGRLTWKGHPVDLGKSPGEVLSLVHLERLAIYAEKALAAKELPEAKSGGADCRVLELGLPKETMRSYSEDAETAEEEEKSVEAVEVTLYIRKSDSLVVKIDATVSRLYKDEEHPNDTSKGRSSCVLTLKEFGAAKVTIPPGLEKLLED